MTQNAKFIRWPSTDKGMQPTEELFDLQNDPYELQNVIRQKSYQSELAALHDLYDNAVDHWQQHAVKHNDYERFGSVFERK